MSKNFYQEEHYYRDDKILVYKRPDSKNYQCRLLLPNHKGYMIQSCKTTNLGRAVQRAEELYDRYSYKLLKRLPLQLKTFADVYANFLRVSNKEKRRAQFYEGCFNRYFSLFFKGMYIDAITKKTFDEYFLWRKNFYKKYPEKRKGNTAIEPSYQTLVLEKKILKEVMKYAYHSKLIPEVPEVVYTDNRRGITSNRDDFTIEEYKKILQKLKEDTSKKARAQIVYQRKMLYWLVVFLANTGIRPSEFYNLQWRDIINIYKIDDKQMILEIEIPTHTKTGKRVVMANPQAYTAYEEIKRFSKYQKGTDLIFTNYDGTSLKNIGKTFTSKLKELGLYVSRNGKKRPLYSLRHYYATERLRKGVSIYDVALNMGTSVQLIEKHYSHTQTYTRRANIVQNANPSIIYDRRLWIGAWYSGNEEDANEYAKNSDELPI